MVNYNYSRSVQKELTRYKDLSEILITYLQLGIVVLITIFYTLAPKGTSGVEVLFQPVPYALTAWFVVLLARFIFAYTRKMHGAIAYIFIALDIALLLALIWSYGLQYQSAALALKAPTFIFLLFFIFLRGLRLEFRYIVFGYAMSVVGWGVLTVLAYRVSEVTHDFFEYTTSNKVLFGAEIEKLLALTACAFVMFLIVNRSKSLLVFSYQQKDAVNNLSLFFNRDVVEQISAGEDTIRPGKGNERHGAIMSIDIRGFTKFSANRSASEVMATISAYQAHIVPIVHANFGSIDKFMGDGILLHFGIADSTPQFAANALRAAEQVIAAIGRWNRERTAKELEPLNIGIGIEIGKVIFGTVGDESRLEFTVIGNAVNIATKLEKATKNYPGFILMTRKTYDTARMQDYSPAYTPFLIKNQRIGSKDNQATDIVTLLTEEQRTEFSDKVANAAG